MHTFYKTACDEMEKHKFDKRKLDECDDNVETCE